MGRPFFRGRSCPLQSSVAVEKLLFCQNRFFPTNAKLRVEGTPTEPQPVQKVAVRRLHFRVSFQKNRYPTADLNFENGHRLFRGIMANNVVTRSGSDDSLRFQPMERLKVYLFGTTVLFASFGMGEAVYRLLFSEFDGATDRIPIEALFGLVFAWLATKFVGDAYRNRKQRSARLNFICARNHQIRGALEGLTPLAHPAKNQQSIRVIREEVERIEWALNEILQR